MVVGFRVDASPAIGNGHLVRCRALARALLRSGRVRRLLFLCATIPDAWKPVLSSDGIEVVTLDFEIESDPIGSLRDSASNARHCASKFGELAGLLDWLVVDHYGIAADWEAVLRSAARRILVIDDLADRLHDCDILVDHNFDDRPTDRYVPLVPRGAVALVGPRFAMLNEDFRRERALLRRQPAPIRRVVVLLGPADLHNVTGMAVEALLGARVSFDEVDVVLGGKHPFAEEISRLAGMSGRFRVHQTLPSMAPLFSTAQLAIGASGTTTLERACLKLPSLVTVIAENQRPVARAIALAAPALWLGDAAELSVEAIRNRFELVADGTHPDLDSRRLPEIDGYGADRIVAHMIGVAQ